MDPEMEARLRAMRAGEDLEEPEISAEEWEAHSKKLNSTTFSYGSLALGIAGLLLGCLRWFLPLLLGAGALGIGIAAKIRERCGVSTAGIIIGTADILIGAVLLIMKIGLATGFGLLPFFGAFCSAVF